MFDRSCARGINRFATISEIRFIRTLFSTGNDSLYFFDFYQARREIDLVVDEKNPWKNTVNLRINVVAGMQGIPRRKK